MSKEAKPAPKTGKVTKEDIKDSVQMEKPSDQNTNQPQLFFTYINEYNSYHTAHVLKKILGAKPENLKYVCLVISSVRPEIAEKILEEFADDIKAVIISELMSLIQYTKKEIENFDKILRRLLTEQFGGKYVLAKILEYLDIDQKINLSSIYKTKYPETEKEFRSIMIMFEDLFKVSEKDFLRIFSEVQSDILSIAFCHQPQEQINRLYDILPKGVKNIVQQGIELGKNKYSKSDINKSQQYIIELSKNLEKDGFIEPILKEELNKT